MESIPTDLCDAPRLMLQILALVIKAHKRKKNCERANAIPDYRRSLLFVAKR